MQVGRRLAFDTYALWIAIFVGFVVGFLAGAATCPEPESFGGLSWIVAYGRALRTIVWDCSAFSKWLQTVSGYPIYSASLTLGSMASSSMLSWI